MNIHSEEGNFQISRGVSEIDIKSTNTVMSKAFNINNDSVNYAFGSFYIQGPGVDLFLARQDDKVISTVQTTCAGSIIGIWGMATLPDQQGKGAGRALLEHVITYHFERGAESFFLVSTPAGKPFYEKMGFQTLAESEVWIFK